MKCIDAYWEVRNLGVRTIEIFTEKDDIFLSADELLDRIENYRLKYRAEYVVVKSDSRYPAVALALQNANFWLIENQIGLRLSRKTAQNIVDKYRKIFSDVSYRIADDYDQKIIFDEIKRGIFKTDRVALDPKFGIEMANRRYTFWIKDALSNGAGMIICLYNGEPFGFNVNKIKKSKICDGLLGGIFNRENNKNYGSMSIYAGYLYMLDCDVISDKTFVSTNNLDVLKLHLEFGRKITDIKNVFVKHFIYNSEDFNGNRGGLLIHNIF